MKRSLAIGLAASMLSMLFVLPAAAAEETYPAVDGAYYHHAEGIVDNYTQEKDPALDGLWLYAKNRGTDAKVPFYQFEVAGGTVESIGVTFPKASAVRNGNSASGSNTVRYAVWLVAEDWTAQGYSPMDALLADNIPDGSDGTATRLAVKADGAAAVRLGSFTHNMGSTSKKEIQMNGKTVTATDADILQNVNALLAAAPDGSAQDSKKLSIMLMEENAINARALFYALRGNQGDNGYEQNVPRLDVIYADPAPQPQVTLSAQPETVTAGEETVLAVETKHIGQIQKVELFRETELLGEAAPQDTSYEYTWTAPEVQAAETAAVHAKVTYGEGAEAESEHIDIAILPKPAFTSVRAQPDTVTAGKAVTLQAAVEANGRQDVAVAFFVGNEKLGDAVKQEGVYQYEWDTKGLPADAYTVHAVLTYGGAKTVDSAQSALTAGVVLNEPDPNEKTVQVAASDSAYYQYLRDPLWVDSYGENAEVAFAGLYTKNRGNDVRVPFLSFEVPAGIVTELEVVFPEAVAVRNGKDASTIQNAVYEVYMLQDDWQEDGFDPAAAILTEKNGITSNLQTVQVAGRAVKLGAFSQNPGTTSKVVVPMNGKSVRVEDQAVLDQVNAWLASAPAGTEPNTKKVSVMILETSGINAQGLFYACDNADSEKKAQWKAAYAGGEQAVLQAFADKTSVRAGETVILTAAANQTGTVRYYLDETLIGQSGEAPYAVDWMTLDSQVGEQTVTAKLDLGGGTVLTSDVKVTVNAKPDPVFSEVAIDPPEAAGGDTLHLAAALDTGGHSVEVSFYIGEHKLEPAAQYQDGAWKLDWTVAGLAAGDYTVHAVASYQNKTVDSAADGKTAALKITSEKPVPNVTLETNKDALDAGKEVLFTVTVDKPQLVQRVELYRDHDLIGTAGPGAAAGTYTLTWVTPVVAEDTNVHILAKVYYGEDEPVVSEPVPVTIRFGGAITQFSQVAQESGFYDFVKGTFTSSYTKTDPNLDFVSLYTKNRGTDVKVPFYSFEVPEGIVSDVNITIPRASLVRNGNGGDPAVYTFYLFAGNWQEEGFQPLGSVFRQANETSANQTTLEALDGMLQLGAISKSPGSTSKVEIKLDGAGIEITDAEKLAEISQLIAAAPVNERTGQKSLSVMILETNAANAQGFFYAVAGGDDALKPKLDITFTDPGKPAFYLNSDRKELRAGQTANFSILTNQKGTVRYWRGNEKLGESNAAPDYQFSWVPMNHQTGLNTIRAEMEVDGQTLTASVEIHVLAKMKPAFSSVSIASETVVQGETVQLQARVNDGGHTDLGVEFYVDGKAVGAASLDEGIWKLDWNTSGTETGKHQLTAVADYEGGKVDSAETGNMAAFVLRGVNDVQQPENLAYKKTVKYSSQISAMPGTHLVDGDLSTGWRSHSSDTSWTVTIDLGSSKNFNQIAFYPLAESIGSVKIQASDNNTDWNDIVQDMQVRDVMGLETGTQKGRYIRFQMKPAEGSVTVQIFEVMVFDSTDASYITALDQAGKDLAALDLGDTENIRRDLTLPGEGANGSTITWYSSRETVITSNGKVTRGNRNQSVTMTAVLYRNGIFLEKNFELTVCAQRTLEQELADISDGINFALITKESPNAITRDLTFPETGVYGVQLNWSSGNTSIISNDGTVNRSGLATDTPVVITVTYVFEGTPGTKVLTVKVKKPQGSGGGGGGGNGGGAGSGNSGSAGGLISGSGTTSVGSIGNVVPTPQPQDNAQFTDLGEAAWAAPYIYRLAERGIVNGNGDGTFLPERAVSREEFVKMVVLAFGILDVNAETDFTDVEAGSWSYAYIASAQKAGLVSGVGGDSFGAGQQITREDMMVIACKALELAGKPLPAAEIDGAYTDRDQVSGYAAGAVAALLQAGIISGVRETEIGPAAPATRAQVAKVIYLIMDYAGIGE